MDEQLKRELQEALYGALAAIYQSNADSKRDKEDQEQKIEIIVSGDSLSLIKTISEENELDNKIAKVASSFELLNGQLKKFNEFNNLGNIEPLVQIGALMSDLAETFDKIDQDKVKELLSVFKTIDEQLNEVNTLNSLKGLADLEKSTNGIRAFIDFVSSPDLHKKIQEATKLLGKKRGGFLGYGGTTLADDIKEFLTTVSTIFDDPQIRKIMFKAPREEDIQGNGVQAILMLLNFFTQDKMLKKIGKVHLAMKLGLDKDIVKFMKNIANGFSDPAIQRVFFEDPRKTTAAASGMNSVIRLIKTLTEPEFLMGVLASKAVLGEKSGRRIGNFIKGFVDVINEIDQKSLNETLPKNIDSITKLVKALTICTLGIGLLGIVIAQTSPVKTLAVMLGIVFGISLLLKGIVKALSGVEEKDLSKFADFVNKTILSLCEGIMILAAASLVIREVGPGDLGWTLGFLIALVGGTVVLSLIAQKFDPSSTEAVKNISMMLLALSGAVFMIGLTALLIRDVGWGDLASALLIYALVVGSAVGIAVLLGKFKDLINEGIETADHLKNLFINLLGAVALIGVTAIVAHLIPTEWLIKTGAIVLAMVGLIFAVGLAMKAGGEELQKAIKAFNLALAGLSISILLISIAGTLAVNITWDHLWAIGLVVVAGLAVIGLIKVAEKIGVISDETINTMLKLELIIAGLALNVMLFALVANVVKRANLSWDNIWPVLVVIGSELIIVALLAAMTMIPGVEHSIKNLVWLVAVMIGLELNVLLLAGVALLINKTAAENGGLLNLFKNLIWIVAGELAVLAILALVNKLIGDKGTLGIVILTACLAGIVGIVYLTTIVAKKAKEVSEDDILWVGAILGQLVAVAGILAAIGGVGISNPVGQAAMLGLAAIEGLLLGLVTVIDYFVSTLGKWKKLTTEYGDLSSVGSEIGGAFGGFLAGLAGSWSSVGGAVLAIVMGIFTGPLLGLMFTISQFVDIVEKVATMNFLEGYDENGKPVYKRVDPAVFGTAAAMIASGFRMFLEGLSDGFRSLGGQGTGVVGWFKKMATGGLVATTIALLADSIGPIMQAVGYFTDSIIKLITGTYTITDEDGNQVTKRVDISDFGVAASTVSNAFKEFIMRLGEGAKSLDASSRNTIMMISKSMSPLMEAVSKFVESIMMFSTGTYTTIDEDGNQVTQLVPVDRFSEAASVITGNFLIFLNTLVARTEEMKYSQRKAIKNLSESILPIMESVGGFVDAIMKLAAGTVTTGLEGMGVTRVVKPGEFDRAAKSVVVWFEVFIKSFGRSVASLDEDAQDAMKNMASALKPLMSGISAFADSILKLATGRYVESYDKDGKPVYKTITKEMYTSAASALVSSMIKFITGLKDGLNGIEKESADVIQKLSKGGIKNLMDGLSKFAKVVADNVYVVEGYDENGKPIFMKDASGNYVKTDELYPTVGETLAKAISKFVTNLVTELGSIEKDISSITKSVKGVCNLADPLKKWLEAMKTFDLETDYDSISSSIKTSLSTFLGVFSDDTILAYSTEEKKKTLKQLKENLSIAVGVAAALNKFGSLDLAKAGEQEKLFISNLSALMSATIPEATLRYKEAIDKYTSDYGILADKVNRVTQTITSASQSGYTALSSLVELITNLGPSSSYIGIDWLQTKLELIDSRIANGLQIEEFVNRVSTVDTLITKVIKTSEELKDLDKVFGIASNGINTTLFSGTTNFETTLNRLLKDLTTLDSGVKVSIKNVKNFGNEFAKTVDKIEDKLKKNEGQRNKMLKDLTTHLDTIGNKLKVISEGLVNINNASMDKVEKLAQVFAEIQNNTIRVMAEQGVFNQQQNDQASTQVPDQASQQNNTNLMVNQQDQRPDNYFGDGMIFEIRDGGQGYVKGILQRMT